MTDFRSNLELAFFEDVSQNSCIFISWTFPAGVFGVVTAMNLSHVYDFVCIHGCFLIASKQYLVNFPFCNRTNRGRDRDL